MAKFDIEITATFNKDPKIKHLYISTHTLLIKNGDITVRNLFDS